MSLDGRATRHLDKRQLACLAANILADPGPFHPTTNQLANMFHVSSSYIAAACKMSPAKRNAILAGHDDTSFTPLLNPPKSSPALLASSATAVADSVLAEIVRVNGVERVLAAAVTVENGHRA
jgi:hypothetical protein